MFSSPLVGLLDGDDNSSKILQVEADDVGVNIPCLMKKQWNLMQFSNN